MTRQRLVSEIVEMAFRLLLSCSIVSDAYAIDGYQYLFLYYILRRQFVPIKTLPLQVFRGSFQAHECYRLFFTTIPLQAVG